MRHIKAPLFLPRLQQPHLTLRVRLLMRLFTGTLTSLHSAAHHCSDSRSSLYLLASRSFSFSLFLCISLSLSLSLSLSPPPLALSFALSLSLFLPLFLFPPLFLRPHSLDVDYLPICHPSVHRPIHQLFIHLSISIICVLVCPSVCVPLCVCLNLSVQRAAEVHPINEVRERSAKTRFIIIRTNDKAMRLTPGYHD